MYNHNLSVLFSNFPQVSKKKSSKGFSAFYGLKSQTNFIFSDLSRIYFYSIEK